MPCLYCHCAVYLLAMSHSDRQCGLNMRGGGGQSDRERTIDFEDKTSKKDEYENIYAPVPGIPCTSNRIFGLLKRKHSAAWSSTAPQGDRMTPHDTAWHRTALRCCGLYSTVQHRTASHNTAPHGRARQGTAGKGRKRQGTSLHGANLLGYSAAVRCWAELS